MGLQKASGSTQSVCKELFVKSPGVGGVWQSFLFAGSGFAGSGFAKASVSTQCMCKELFVKNLIRLGS